MAEPQTTVYVLYVEFPNIHDDPQFDLINVSSSLTKAKKQAQAHMDMCNEYAPENLVWNKLSRAIFVSKKTTGGDIYKIQKRVVL